MGAIAAEGVHQSNCTGDEAVLWSAGYCVRDASDIIVAMWFVTMTIEICDKMPLWPLWRRGGLVVPAVAVHNRDNSGGLEQKEPRRGRCSRKGAGKRRTGKVLVALREDKRDGRQRVLLAAKG